MNMNKFDKNVFSLFEEIEIIFSAQLKPGAKSTKRQQWKLLSAQYVLEANADPKTALKVQVDMKQRANKLNQSLRKNQRPRRKPIPPTPILRSQLRNQMTNPIRGKP